MRSSRVNDNLGWALQWLKSPAPRLFTQSFIQTQIKENIKAPRHWPLCGDRWIPRTNGQWRGKCFHLMTSSWERASGKWLCKEALVDLDLLITGGLCDLDLLVTTNLFDLDLLVRKAPGDLDLPACVHLPLTILTRGPPLSPWQASLPPFW